MSKHNISLGHMSSQYGLTASWFFFNLTPISSEQGWSFFFNHINRYCFDLCWILYVYSYFTQDFQYLSWICHQNCRGKMQLDFALQLVRISRIQKHSYLNPLVILIFQRQGYPYLLGFSIFHWQLNFFYSHRCLQNDLTLDFPNKVHHWLLLLFHRLNYFVVWTHLCICTI